MNLGHCFKTAITGLKTNKTRTALTILGIVIGISSVVVMVSLGQGAHNLIVGQIVSTGANNIFIEPGSWSKQMEKGSGMQSMMEEMEIKTLTYEDAQVIAKEPAVELVAPLAFGVERAIYQNKNKKITLLGTTPESFEMNNSQAIMGTLFDDKSVKSMSREVVLGYNIKEDLFGEEDPIGQLIRIKKTNFRVRGVIEEQGMQMFMNLDEVIYIPLTTAQKVLLGSNHLNQIIVRVVSEDRIEETIEDIRLILRERHGIDNPEGDLAKDDFKVISQKETAEILATITTALTLFLSAVAAIALLVGGIGIMNIMLVSVTERTREVGLRKAVGARRKDILNQFLLEAVTLTILGGIIGIILGIGASFLGGIILGQIIGIDWGFNLSLNSIVLAFGVSTIIGLIFGIYPARKAAGLSPIDALRYE